MSARCLGGEGGAEVFVVCLENSKHEFYLVSIFLSKMSLRDLFVAVFSFSHSILTHCAIADF